VPSVGYGRYDEDNYKKADDFDMECIVIAPHSGNHQSWPPTDHFERLLEEAYPNHTYPINPSPRTATS
jgi:hypothetical protein